MEYHMKLMLAIVNNDDSAVASSALTEKGFFVTKLSTTGGFLMVGNTTLLIGTEDEYVDEVMKILKKHCVTRKHVSSPTASFGIGLKKDSLPREVNVGGATVFVLNVEKTIKI
jgi:uncharacterized protein YaaQ